MSKIESKSEAWVNVYEVYYADEPRGKKDVVTSLETFGSRGEAERNKDMVLYHELLRPIHSYKWIAAVRVAYYVSFDPNFWP